MFLQQCFLLARTYLLSVAKGVFMCQFPRYSFGVERKWSSLILLQLREFGKCWLRNPVHLISRYGCVKSR